MIKKDKAIVFMVTRTYKFALATIIMNLQEKNRYNYDDIVVYHDGLMDSEQRDLRKIETNLTFIHYPIKVWLEEMRDYTIICVNTCF